MSINGNFQFPKFPHNLNLRNRKGDREKNHFRPQRKRQKIASSWWEWFFFLWLSSHLTNYKNLPSFSHLTLLLLQYDSRYCLANNTFASYAIFFNVCAAGAYFSHSFFLLCNFVCVECAHTWLHSGSSGKGTNHFMQQYWHNCKKRMQTDKVLHNS